MKLWKRINTTDKKLIKNGKGRYITRKLFDTDQELFYKHNYLTVRKMTEV